MFPFQRVERACLVVVGLWTIMAGMTVSAAERSHPICRMLLPWHKHAESASPTDSAPRREPGAAVVSAESAADQRVRQAELARVFESSASRQKIEHDRTEDREWRLRHPRFSGSGSRIPHAGRRR